MPQQLANLRRFALDGALLLFDRNTGLNALCEGDETATLIQQAPRMVQFGITNSCNLACTFCSRDVEARSEWTADEVFTLLKDLAGAGVLEVAFGGGEPWLFPNFSELVERLYHYTPLAINLTTNGLALTSDNLAEIRGKFGQIRLSLYDNNEWRQRVIMLAEQRARFGVNYLVTPTRLRELEGTVLELCELGCRDILLLSYNGYDESLHLSRQEAFALAQRVELLAKVLSRRCQIKLGVCWGEQLATVPRLFERQDCGAGRDFIVLTSDKKMQPCSFHQVAIPVRNAEDVMEIWRHRRGELSSVATLPGCARALDSNRALLEPTVRIEVTRQ